MAVIRTVSPAGTAVMLTPSRVGARAARAAGSLSLLRLLAFATLACPTFEQRPEDKVRNIAQSEVPSEATWPLSRPASIFKREESSEGSPRGFFELREDLSPQSELERIYSDHSVAHAEWHAAETADGLQTAIALIRQKEEREGRAAREAKVLGRRRGRKMQATGSINGGVPPGPQCVGQCCSNAAPMINPGVPRMTSTWLSNQLAHGAKVSEREGWGCPWWMRMHSQCESHMPRMEQLAACEELAWQWWVPADSNDCAARMAFVMSD